MPNDYYPDLDDDEEETPRETNPLAILRKQNRDLKKALAEQQKQAEELLKFREETERLTRTASVAEQFNKFGLNQKWAKFFPGDTEPTDEAIRTFATEYELGEVSAPAAPENKPFAPVKPGGSPSAAMVTYEDYQKILKENPNEAFQMVADGRVEGLASTLD